MSTTRIPTPSDEFQALIKQGEARRLGSRSDRVLGAVGAVVIAIVAVWVLVDAVQTAHHTHKPDTVTNPCALSLPDDEFLKCIWTR